MSSFSAAHLQPWQRLREEHSRHRTTSVDGTEAEREEVVDPLTLACRERYARFEKRIAALFPTNRPCCPAPPSPILLEFDGEDGALANGTAHEPEKPSAPAARQAEDDDYDMDEDDEDEEPAAKPKTPLQQRAPGTAAVSQMGSPKVGTPGDTKKTVVAATREKLEADRKEAEAGARNAFSTIFYTLENDRDAMLEQQKLDESDRQVNAEANAQGGPQQGKLSTANLGASSLTLKHLIARIDAKRERVAVSDMELRNLMSEVKKNRSKWASEDKVGQEELYEAAEKVVLELRAQTEHSTAFLNRVNKREAPDYFNIIKHPMDLGTVMKKLKQLAYKSKKEFVDDLMLIWQNCLTYNGDPSHYLRKHALAMKKMTLNLIPLIPEITIRDRAEVEAEEAGGQDADAEAESDDEPIMSSRMNRKGPGTKKARKGSRPSRTEGTPEVKPPVILNLPREGGRDSPMPGHIMGEHGSQHGSQNGFGTPIPGGTPFNGMSNIDVDPAADKLEMLDDNDIEYNTWKSLTKKARAKAAAARHKLFRNGKLQVDEPALMRTGPGMARYIRAALKHNELCDPSKNEAPAQLVPDAEEDEDSDEYQLPNYYRVMDGVPDLPWNIIWHDDMDEADRLNENLRLAPRGIFTQPKNGLSKTMDANIKLMQDTRKVCSKIGVIKQMQSQVQIYANQFQKYEPQEFIEQEPEDFIISETGPIMAEEVSRAALQRTIGKIFYHAGFEDYQPSALECVTDMACEFFQKISRTLVTYQETRLPSGRFAPDELILHTLQENGLDVESLDSYVRDDVDRLQSKLTTINERMKIHLSDLLRPALADVENPDATNEGMNHFISGDFSEDIGDDFFGFKELGLDKEFGLSSLSVPLHLLQGRLNNTYQSHNANAATSATEHVAPPPFEPLTHDVLKTQIGLVQNFFLAKLHANNEEPLVEDEDLPPKQRPSKPRLPPTGKITMPRKRPVQSQGGNSKKKKKPNPPANSAAVPSTNGTPSNAKVNAVASQNNPGLTATPPASDTVPGKFEETEMENTGGMISPESIAAA